MIKEFGDAFICVYHPIAGWKAQLVVWDDEFNTYIPEMTDYIAYDTRAEAVESGKMWAEMEDLLFVDEL